LNDEEELDGYFLENCAKKDVKVVFLGSLEDEMQRCRWQRAFQCHQVTEHV